MADPSLGLGAASIAFQLLEGVKKGCEYFSKAANMPADCEALGWRLQMEYSKLLDWADSAGLTDDRTYEFAEKLRVDPIIVTAVLGEMNVLLGNLSELGRHYHELQVRPQPVGNDLNRQQSFATEVVSADVNEADIQVTVTHAPATAAPIRPPIPRKARKVAVKDVDLQAFAAIFESSDIPAEKRKYTKGFNHIIEFGKDLRDIGKHPKRLVWTVHHKEKFERIMTRLMQLTTYLQQTLGDSRMHVLMEQTQANCMALLQLMSTTEDTINLLKAVKLDGQGSANESGDTASVFSTATTTVYPPNQTQSNYVVTANGSPDLRETLFERLTRFSLAYSQILAAQDPEKYSYTPFKLDEKDGFDIILDDKSKRATFTAARYNDRNVWVEWKGYKEVPITASEGETVLGPSPFAIQQVKQLVALLQADTKPIEFSIPRCLGYFQDAKTTRFGFVYDLVTHSPSSAPPTSLFQLLRGSAPPIRARVAIAQELTVTLVYLHAVNWVHKGLRSASVVFFSNSEGPVLSHPYISGFEYARPDQYGVTATAPPTEFEWSVYCHPDYQGQEHKGFRKSYDMYSLGMILLEIAHWKSASAMFENIAAESTKVGAEPTELTGEQGGEPNSLQIKEENHFNIRSEVLRPGSPFLEHVRNTMGDRYYNAVKACIQGEEYFMLDPKADQTDRVVSAVLQQGFMRLVVDALKSIAI